MTDYYGGRATPIRGDVVEDAPEPTPVYNLDRVIAERDVVEPFRFAFGGDTYVLPARPDIRGVAAAQANRLEDALRLLLGQQQWEQLQAVDAVFDDKALEDLFTAYMKHAGLDLGE